MSRDCPDFPNGPTGPNNGQPNMPDLYQWSGDQPQQQPGGGKSHGGPGPQGGPPDLYQYDGEQPGNAQAGSDQSGQGGAENPAIANWHPDYSYSSPSAQAWLKSNEQTRGQALQMNADGSYTVQFGDCLSTIAQRALQDEGNKSPDQNQINGEMSTIIQANDKKYSSLDYNKDYLQAGWKIRVPGEAMPSSGQSAGPGDNPLHHQCVPHPEGNMPYFPPPPGYHGRPSVIINNYYIRGNAYVNEGGGMGQGGSQGQGQMSPQHRFQCHGQQGGQQAESYYNGQGQSYNPSMQYQWAPQSASGGNSSGNWNGQYYNSSNWNNPGQGNYGGSQYYNQYGGGQNSIQLIPNAYPGEGQAIPIPNATGSNQAQLINYEYPQSGGQTYPAQYYQTEQD